MVNKHKLKEIKLKITKDSVLETTPHSIKRDISAKNFFISKRTFIGGGDSSTKSSQTLDSSGLFFKNISASKKSLLYSDHTKSTQRLNKSTVSTVHSEALSTANKDSGRGIEIAKITKVKPQDNKKPTSAYKNLFSSLVERTNDCRAYKILSPKKVHF